MHTPLARNPAVQSSAPVIRVRTRVRGRASPGARRPGIAPYPGNISFPRQVILRDYRRVTPRGLPAFRRACPNGPGRRRFPGWPGAVPGGAGRPVVRRAGETLPGDLAWHGARATMRAPRHAGGPRRLPASSPDAGSSSRPDLGRLPGPLGRVGTRPPCQDASCDLCTADRLAGQAQGMTDSSSRSIPGVTFLGSTSRGRLFGHAISTSRPLTGGLRAGPRAAR